FYGYRPILVFQHGAGILGMQHYPTVTIGITRCIFLEFSSKSILNQQVIVREGAFEIQMCKLVIISTILIIPNLNKTILHPESISKIHSHIMMIDLHDPVADMLAIE